VIGAAAVQTNFRFDGNVSLSLTGVPQFPAKVYLVNNANGGEFSVVPWVHYVTPLQDKLAFGFNVTAPFGLKTNYTRHDTFARYAATLSSVSVVNVSPSLAYQITDAWSFGAGLDYQRMEAELNSMVNLLIAPIDVEVQNKAKGHGYGFHLGTLYQFSEKTRAGLSYHSRVHHHLRGSSSFKFVDHPVRSDNAKVNITLPDYTALSVYHRLNQRYGLMASAVYTHWSLLDQLAMQNLAGLNPGAVPSTAITAVLPQHYRNTWNLSVGNEIYLSDIVTLRAALGYDQSPVNGKYRDIRLPDNDRYIVAMGMHYQFTKAFGMDLSWDHFIMRSSNINTPPLATGALTMTSQGRAKGFADVFAAQLTWDIA
jgi:long-chain fatty acid transport protein